MSDELLLSGRIARLGTADQHARPHVVPIVFAYLIPHLYTPIDRKPKSVDDWRMLRRIHNIETNGRVSVVIDEWSEDWSRLRYVLLEGTADILEDGEERDQAEIALTAKYPQYDVMPLAGCPIIRVTIEKRTDWRAEG